MSLDLLSLAWCLASLGGAIVIGVLFTRARNHRAIVSTTAKSQTHGESTVSYTHTQAHTELFDWMIKIILKEHKMVVSLHCGFELFYTGPRNVSSVQDGNGGTCRP